MKPSVKIGLVIVAGLIGIVFMVLLFRTGKAEAGAAVNIGKTETTSNLSSSSTSCASDNSGFSSRHVLLLADNPHPLSRQIATLLEQQLKECPLIERLEMTNAAFVLTNGTEAPDLFLNVNLVELKESGILSSTKKSTVTASLGNAPWQSSNYTTDNSTPPLVSFTWNGTLELETTFTGIRTDGYADIARSAATEFAKAIRKQIEELAGKYPALPELPRDFYGPYQPVTDFECLTEVHARRVASYCGLLTHNQTFWKFQTATNPVPQLQHIISQLEASGWKFSDTRLTNTGDYFAHGRHGEADLEIFRQRDDRAYFSTTESKKTALDFVTHYRQPLSQTERESALEKLFAGERPVETLLPFQNLFSPAQRKRFYALMEKSPATSPSACIQLAGIYLDRKHTNDAINMLILAKALTATVKDAAALDASIETVVKKISPKQTLKLVVTPETCRELGFLEITNLLQNIETDRRFSQPLVLFGADPRGVKIYSLVVGAPQKDSYPWALLQVQDGSRSSSTSSFSRDWRESFTFDGQTLKINAVPLPDKKAIKFTIEVSSQTNLPPPVSTLR